MDIVSKFKKWRSVRSGVGGQSTSHVGHGRTGLLILFSSLTVLGISFPIRPPALFDLPVAETASGQITFTAAGDLGISAFSDASLRAIPTAGAVFHLALGDLSYNGTGTEASFCDYVTSRVGDTFPFELVSGNHEDGSADAPGPDGYIGNFAACLPDRINGLPYSSGYAKEYYFDYPLTNSLVRIVMISPALRIDGVSYNYSVGRPNYSWLSDTIDDARNSRIPWVFVGMHKPCITMGIKRCETGADIMNLLISKRVDLVLQGHDHNYQRSKQLTCAGTPTRTVEAAYDPSCVIDDGSDDAYMAGAGTVFVINGAFGGGGFAPLNITDPETPYFAKAMGGQSTVWGGSASGTGRGFVKYTVSADRIYAELVITAQTTPGTLFSDSFSIAKKNEPPVISVPTAQAVDESVPLSITVTATDPDAGQILTLSASGLPAGATFNPATGVFSWTPGEADGPGDFTLSFTATDNGSPQLSDTKTVMIHVGEVNTKPVITVPGPQTVNEESLLTFTITATDADLPSQTLIFSAISLPPGATFDPATGTFSWTPTEAQESGIFLATFQVSDGMVADVDNVLVTVNEVNKPPVLDPVGDKSVLLETLLTFTVTASDVDIAAQTLSFTIGPAPAGNFPAGATIDPATGVFSWTPTASQGAGVYNVRILVSDGTAQDSEDLAITVAETEQAPSRPSEPWQQYWYLIVAVAGSAVAIPILVRKIPRTKTPLTEQSNEKENSF